MTKKQLYKDFFLHADITVMVALLAAIAGTHLALYGASFRSAIFFAAGLIGFMFSEYLTHRFFFHLKAPSNPFFLKLLKRLHYDHHSFPNDLKLLFLPLWYSLPIFVVFVGACYLITDLTDASAAFAAGLIAMLLIYEWKHYVAHRPLQPRTKLGKWVKKTHLLHHFKNENFWYGVSTPFVDAIFGTLKDEKQVPTSAFVKDLEGR
ncbi:sterol desaturase family protein [Paenibacillus sp. LHD-117]|uniref:sterol desaturase family protein n=1 Tax=Paenibacillus sp. LHD-117 TaxID=3071412 RepID=UPI0027DFE8B7|nr:sterol desaturase family protein [Paenibacillus sp. LHD-117]MDQ6418875.1 sterol desaturase family protein [Paenibacillus sp. LHD-117]